MPEANFVHLHLHTDFSLLDGACDISSLVEEAALLADLKDRGLLESTILCGYDVIQSNDFTWQFPPVTSFDWTPYTLDVQVPAGAKVLEVRTHVYARFTGTIYWDDIGVSVIGSATAVKGRGEVPATFELGDNYPNPFNPTTVIMYAVPSSQYVSLKVTNVLGQQVAELVGGMQSPGYKSVEWDASKMASGVYFYRLHTGTFTLIRKMVLAK